MSTAQAAPHLTVNSQALDPRDQEVTIYFHSPLLYWWPVWAIGYLMALLTFFEGDVFVIGGKEEWIHPSKNLGVIYTLVFFLVILMTNVTLRGLTSVVVIVSALALTIFFAYMGWWDDIVRAFHLLSIHMNMGFYVTFSTMILMIWILAVFVFDRMNYWIFRPGQVVHQMVLGGGARTYDTMGISVYKLRDDLFRHWILGLGSGDLHIATTGAKKEEYVLPNVLFIGRKIRRIEEVVAVKPGQKADRITAGEPT